MNKVIHLRGLNGIRAMAALSVLIAHITGELTNFGLYNSLGRGGESSILMASYGVTMFFALSGFLITYLLLTERQKIKTINIKKFYIRRILRIWPLYYLYFLIVLVVYGFYNINYREGMIPFYVLLAANIPIILQQSLPLLGHLWSIGVEEQFYLFWPWVTKISTKGVVKFSIIFFIAFYLLKILLWLISYKYNYNIPIVTITVTRFNIMMIGCIGASLYYKKSGIIKSLTTKKVQIFCWFILFLAAFNKFNISSSLVNHEVIGGVIVLIILAQIERKNFIINLDNRILNFIGEISYGMYVYHPLIIFLLYKSLGKFNNSTIFNYAFVYGVTIALTVIVSWVSYTYYEKTFIKLKSKYQIAKSSA